LHTTKFTVACNQTTSEIIQAHGLFCRGAGTWTRSWLHTHAYTNQAYRLTGTLCFVSSLKFVLCYYS